MSGFLHPAFLWGLAGLAIPIGIHLLSRKEGKIIKVGSLRHLRSSESPTFKSIKLNEVWLLVVRCLLLTAIVFFISQLFFPSFWSSENNKWVLIDPAIEVDQSLETILDSLESDGYELHSLVSGFPERESATEISDNDYWSLATMLAQKTDTEIIVFSGNQFNKFQGKRISLPKNIEWIVISEDEGRHEFISKAIRTGDTKIQVRKGSATTASTSFETIDRQALPTDKYFVWQEDSIPINAPDTIHVAIVADTKYEYDQKILKTSLETIKNATTSIVEINVGADDDKHDWIFWLSDRQPPLNRNCIFYKQEETTPLMKQVSVNRWQLTKRLNQEVASKNQFTTTLFDMLIPEGEVNRVDERVLPEGQAFSDAKESTNNQKAAAFTDQRWLFLVIIFLFFVERAMAYSKKL